MTSYDANGSQIVTTATREERLAQDDAPVVHFVQPERVGWSWE